MAFKTGLTNHAASNSAANPTHHFLAGPPPKASIWNRLFGVPPTQTTPAVIDGPEIKKDDEAGSNLPLPRPARGGEKMNVWVTKPARTPLDAFKDTISEGTRLFCEQNVHPLYVEDHQTKFRVTGIKMYVPKGDSQLTSVLEELPIDVRNRLARLRAKGAPGAAEQLVFDESFFGISIDIAPAIIEGQQIRLIAAWSEGSIEIKMVFTGQYITVKEKPEESAGSAAKPVSDVIPPDSIAPITTTAVVPALHAEPVDPPLPSADVIAFAPPVQAIAVLANRSKDTPLGTPTPVKTGTDTPMAQPTDLPIALVRILPFGGAQETVIRLTSAMLPFLLGREHTSNGRFANGYSLAKENDEQIARLVSREHFELNHFDRDESRFYVVNHAVEKNGSFHNGCNLPERFSFKAVANKNAFMLGGSNGAGTVRIVVEAV